MAICCQSQRETRSILKASSRYLQITQTFPFINIQRMTNSVEKTRKKQFSSNRGLSSPVILVNRKFLYSLTLTEEHFIVRTTFVRATRVFVFTVGFPATWMPHQNETSMYEVEVKSFITTRRVDHLLSRYT